MLAVELKLPRDMRVSVRHGKRNFFVASYLLLYPRLFGRQGRRGRCGWYIIAPLMPDGTAVKKVVNRSSCESMPSGRNAGGEQGANMHSSSEALRCASAREVPPGAILHDAKGRAYANASARCFMALPSKLIAPHYIGRIGSFLIHVLIHGAVAGAHLCCHTSSPYCSYADHQLC